MNDERSELDALLVRRATEGLRPDETDRLERLLARHPEVDPDWADRVVGELDADWSAGAPAVDDLLRARLLASAPGGEPMTRASHSPGPDVPAGHRPPAAWTRWMGWAVAAGLGALLLTSGGPDTADPRTALEPTSTDASDPAMLPVVDPARPGTVVASWTPGSDATGADVSGEVVWDALRQIGLMRFRGLAANAPDEFQYQLWIFDRERDERYPVDGGVFDMPAGVDEVQVAIAARLPVGEPTLFAVTVERPGGVVVSDRSRIATLAEVLE